MCFNKNIGNFSEIRHKVAEEPIICWKIMNMRVTDDDEYEVNSVYYPRDEWYKVGDVIETKGNMRDSTHLLDMMSSLSYQAVHSYIKRDNTLLPSLSLITKDNLFVFVKCEIPKGETYWVNTFNGEFASYSVQIKEISFECCRISAEDVDRKKSYSLISILPFEGWSRTMNGTHVYSWYTIEKLDLRDIFNLPKWVYLQI